MKAGWTVRRLGDLLEVQNGYAFDSKEFNPSKGMPLIRIRSLKAGVETETRFSGSYDNKYVVNEGDLLIGMDGEFGCYAWKGESALLNQRVCRLQGFDLKLVPRFLFYGVNSYLKAIEDVTGFTTVKHISSKQILDIDFPIPPLPEQQRIVTLLDEAFDGIATARAHAEKNLQNARDLFASHLQTVFFQKGDGWTGRSVQQLINEGILAKPQDGNHGEIHPTKADYVDVGVPFIMAADLSDGAVDTENCRFISETQARTLRIGFAKSGDVLLSHKGTIGRVAVLETNDDYIVLTPQVTYYRSLDSQRLDNGFLYYCLLSPVFQTEMNRIADAGSTRAYIGITRQLDLQIALPSINTQQELAARLRKIQETTVRLEALYQQKLTALNELKKSLLHRAFNGDL